MSHIMELFRDCPSKGTKIQREDKTGLRTALCGANSNSSDIHKGFWVAV